MLVLVNQQGNEDDHIVIGGQKCHTDCNGWCVGADPNKLYEPTSDTTYTIGEFDALVQRPSGCIAKNMCVMLSAVGR